ncbi:MULTISPECIES: DUF1295 domain-containing protein [Listeria]|uniref:DUF1295 domain-containing protein n=1 Tax=Listeria TaxID=1637 RepID=UPI000B58EADA|nr:MULTISPECIES: DUF1295 domain-containing protein [Listeria]
MYGIHQKTTAAKVFIFITQIIYLILAFFILYRDATLDNYIRYTIIIFLLITFLRLNAMLFIWLPRGISWKESIGNSLAFAIYYIGFPLFTVYSQADSNIAMYVIGIVLFLAGSFINTTSELLRKPFKADPANKGKLYRGGLFKYAIHINYFGDILWVAGFALVTINVWALLVPLFLFLMFVFSYIPNADKYLLEKYGSQFEDYQKHTKRLIPFIW